MMAADAYGGGVVLVKGSGTGRRSSTSAAVVPGRLRSWIANRAASSESAIRALSAGASIGGAQANNARIHAAFTSPR